MNSYNNFMSSFLVLESLENYSTRALEVCPQEIRRPPGLIASKRRSHAHASVQARPIMVFEAHASCKARAIRIARQIYRPAVVVPSINAAAVKSCPPPLPPDNQW
jgi:hypothetical protein